MFVSFVKISHSSIEGVGILSVNPIKQPNKSARNEYFDIEVQHSPIDKK